MKNYNEEGRLLFLKHPKEMSGTDEASGWGGKASSARKQVTRKLGESGELWGTLPQNVHMYVCTPWEAGGRDTVTHDVTALAVPTSLPSPSAWPWPTYPAPKKHQPEKQVSQPPLS